MLVYQHSFNDLGFTECLLSHLTSKKIHFLVPKLPAVPTTHLMLFLVLTDIVVDTPISLPLCIVCTTMLKNLLSNIGLVHWFTIFGLLLTAPGCRTSCRNSCCTSRYNSMPPFLVWYPTWRVTIPYDVLHLYLQRLDILVLNSPWLVGASRVSDPSLWIHCWASWSAFDS